jgi:hypothetical protein
MLPPPPLSAHRLGVVVALEPTQGGSHVGSSVVVPPPDPLPTDSEKGLRRGPPLVRAL